MNRSKHKLNKYLLLTVLLVMIGMIWILYCPQQPIKSVYSFLRHDIHPGTFLLLMGLLPVFGFPMSPFLALAGVKFGTIWGMVLSLLTIPIHLAMCYVISKTFFQTIILKVMQSRGYSPPAFLTAKPGKLVMLFLIAPGPPYVMKNYILALTGLPFVSYMALTWLVQGVLASPIVILGGVASQHRWGLFTLTLMVLILGTLLLHWYRNRMKKTREGEPYECDS